MTHSENRVVPMRLQKFLARAGVASRRGSENLMTAGRVSVNGQVVRELGSKVDPATDAVEVDGCIVNLGSSPCYLMLHKPQGYITTMSDPYGRPCVADLVPTREYPGLFSVGRLDCDTTGILLFTTNGDVAQALLHPSSHVEKHYIALVEGRPTNEQVRKLCAGIELEDGMTAPAKVDVLESAGKSTAPFAKRNAPIGTSVVGITLHEGRKHQVKRMLKAVGHPVLKLHRDKFGPLQLTNCDLGSWRLLDESEVHMVESIARNS